MLARSGAALIVVSAFGAVAAPVNAAGNPPAVRIAPPMPVAPLRGPLESWSAAARRFTGARFATSAHSNGAAPTVTVGVLPLGAAVDYATDTIYVPDAGNDFAGDTVSVIDGATCNATHLGGCRQTPSTVTVGESPLAVAIDQATDTIYVPNGGLNGSGDTVSVIDGATCNAQVTSGCDQTPPTITVGETPDDVAFDPATDTLYTTNLSGDTVSVIDAATCNAQVTSGCGQTPQTIAVGQAPSGVVVDDATDTVYVANEPSTAPPQSADTLSVIDGATCNAHVTSGCGQTPTTVRVGTGSTDYEVAMAVDDASKTLYVSNFTDNTLSMLDTAECNATVTNDCGLIPPVVNVGSEPNALAVDRATHTLYVANGRDDTLSAINAATCNATDGSGCGQPVGRIRVGNNPGGYPGAAIDPATDTLYVTNIDDATVSVVDSATCNATDHSGCTQFPPTVTVGPSSTSAPYGIAVDSATHTAYVANIGDDTVSVIDDAACNAMTATGCRVIGTVRVGAGPALLAVDQATDTVYVANYSGGTVSVIDGATCNASDHAGCRQTPPSVKVGALAFSPAVDQATDTIYVTFDGAEGLNRTMAVINGATCNSTDHAGCDQTPAQVHVGVDATTAVVDQATDTVYVANEGTSQSPGHTVSVIDGATCNGTDHAGCDQTAPAIDVGTFPYGADVDQATDTIYVSNVGNNTVSVIDGAICDGTVDTGCGQTPPTVSVGPGPSSLAVDQGTERVFVPDIADDTLSVIDGTTCNATDHSGCGQTPKTLLVGGGPTTAAVDQSICTVYVTNQSDGTVSILTATR